MAGVTKVFNATTTGALPAIASPGARAFHKFAWQVKGVGAAPTSFSVTLEGSLDSVNYNTIGTAITTPDGIIGYAIDKPSLFVRPTWVHSCWARQRASTSRSPRRVT